MIPWLRPSSAHFDQVVRAYSSELFQYASWLCRDRHRAEDVLQEAFARAWKNWGQVEDESGRRSWLYTIVRNEFLRDTGRAKARMEEPEDDEPVDIADDIDFTCGVEIRDLLVQLPEKFLEPLLLQNLMGMSCEEIAAVMGLSGGATMTRLTRARMALHQLMHGATEPNATPAKPALRLVQTGGAK
ncbi:MAG TPA: sigma-70 family RNA polymerase sigma factor [Usitatibacteraceae bacterium]